MILILADAGDLGALWLRTALRRVLPVPVVAVSPARLVYAPAIVQHLSTGGGTSRFTLGDGTAIDFADVRAVVNRLTNVPTDHFARADAADRDYATMELHAFLLGWLAALDGPVLNPPAPESLSGAWHSDVCALHLAAMAGLSCPAAQVSADGPLDLPVAQGGDAHYVLDDQVIGPLLPVAMRDAMLQFARLWGARLVQIDTEAQGDGRRLFRAASSLVDFPRGGVPLVRALARALAA